MWLLRRRAGVDRCDVRAAVLTEAKWRHQAAALVTVLEGQRWAGVNRVGARYLGRRRGLAAMRWRYVASTGRAKA